VGSVAIVEAQEPVVTVEAVSLAGLVADVGPFLEQDAVEPFHWAPRSRAPLAVTAKTMRAREPGRARPASEPARLQTRCKRTGRHEPGRHVIDESCASANPQVSRTMRQPAGRHDRGCRGLLIRGFRVRVPGGVRVVASCAYKPATYVRSRRSAQNVINACRSDPVKRRRSGRGRSRRRARRPWHRRRRVVGACVDRRAPR
jgi:hypothetical protein